VKHDKPSGTAEGVAAIRYLTSQAEDPGVRCPDTLSHRFLGWKFRLLAGPLRGLAERAYEKQLPGIFSWIVARTRFFDESLTQALEAGAEQIAIVGAGYDTRAWRFEDALRRCGARVVEIDHPATQARKRARLGDALPPHVTLWPADLMHTPLQRVLEQAGFVAGKKSLFLWEGVSMYLDEAAVKATVTAMTALGPGTLITFDFVARCTVDNTRALYGGPQMVANLKRRGEPLTWGLDPEAHGDWLKQFDLMPLKTMGPDEAQNEYLKRLDGKPHRRVCGFNFATRAVVQR
jgi:methyltransferase (TIGR00027 family)